MILLNQRLLKQHFNKQVIILIDEYDLVFNRINKNKFDVQLIQTIYKIVTKNNNNVTKAIMTGVLPNSIAQVTSGHNHFIKCGVMQSRFAQHFGFTQYQIDKLINQCFQQKPKDIKLKIKNWYNGYQIGQFTIYNPWSIMQCLEAFSRNQKDSLQAYWSDTASTKRLESLFKKINNFQHIEKLLNTGFIKKFQIKDSYNQEQSAQNNFFFLLVNCGYLTKEQELQRFKIPNFQVHKSFYIRKIFKIWFQYRIGNKKTTQSLKITQENFQNCEQYQKQLNEEILPVLFVGEKNEIFFSLVLGCQQQFYPVYHLQQAKYILSTQVYNTNQKRIDTMFLPIQGKSNTVIIHQYKVDNSKPNQIKNIFEDAFWEVYANCYIQYALREKIFLRHYQFFKIRVLVFYKHNLKQKPWMIKIKQYQHSISQARLLVQLFENFVKFNDKVQRNWYLQKLRVNSIYQILDKVKHQYNNEDFKQEIQELNKSKEQWNIQKGHIFFQAKKSSQMSKKQKNTRKKPQMQQLKQKEEQKEEKEQQQGQQQEQHQGQKQKGKGKGKQTKKRGKSKSKPKVQNKSKPKNKSENKPDQQNQEKEKGQKQEEQEEQQMQQIQRSLNQQNAQRPLLFQMQPNQRKQQNYPEKQYSQPRVDNSVKQQMCRFSERVRRRQRDQQIGDLRRQQLRQSKEDQE